MGYAIILDFYIALILVGCFDPTSGLSAYEMEFLPGQNLTFPATHAKTYRIKCQNGTYWPDGTTIRNLTCYSNKWNSLPSRCLGMIS